ncbi:MAG: ABC transporter substrate-binding protein [Acidimicrobiia bacterium]|nr:ABC transporter substrate-binding protein [Acidimicrobiia bacterium]
MTDPLRVGGVPEHFNLPWHLGLADNRFAEPGMTWTDMPGGTGQMMQALHDGELDLAIVLTEGAIASVAQGTPARLVRWYTTSPLQWGVHVRGGRDLSEAALGPEHRVAVSRRGSGSHLMAHVLADRLGYDIADDRFVVVGDLDGARRALADGDADLFLWDRFMTSPLVASGEFARVGVQPTPWPAFVTAAHTDVLDAGRSVEIANLLDAVASVADELTSDDDAASLIAERYSLAFDEAAAWLSVTTFDEGEPADEDDVVEIAEQLVELDLIEAVPEAKALVVPL